jgi:ZIP family zinc transporter
VAGEQAAQRRRVRRFHRRHQPRGSEVTVLAGATSIEELIEGISIGTATALEPGLGVVIALAIMLDNVSEALSIGQLIREDHEQHRPGPGKAGQAGNHPPAPAGPPKPVPNPQGHSSPPAQGGLARPILGWTGLIGLSLLVSTLAGWFLLRGLPEPVLGFLLAMGAGGMLYLTVTDLVPEAEAHQYQQSSALALATAFVVIFIISQVA